MEGRHPLALEMVEAPPRPCVTVQHAQILVQRELAIGEPVMRTGQNRQAAVRPWSAHLPQPEINSSRDLLRARPSPFVRARYGAQARGRNPQ